MTHALKANRFLFFVLLFGAGAGCSRTNQSATDARKIPIRINLSSAVDEAFDRNNNPLSIDPFLKRRFDSGTLSGSLGKIPWSDSFWPSQQAGIAARWLMGKEFNNYTAHTYTPEELKSLSYDDLARLSPAEKYDIFQGKADTYPTTRWARQNNFASAPFWSGLCHGWAPASLNYDEPSPVLMQSPYGVLIPFGSSDIKALLSHYQGEIARIQAPAAGSFVGDACKADGPECKGLNAGTFHLALTEEIGRKRKGVIIDATRGLQVWNFPVFAYNAKVLQERAAQNAAGGHVKEILIENTISYALEIEPQWTPLGDAGQAVRQVTYRYFVELNAKEEITGGTWLDENLIPAPTTDHPDFLWTKARPVFLDAWKPLQELYEASLL